MERITKITEEDISTVLALAMAAADKPLAELEFDSADLDFDLDDFPPATTLTMSKPGSSDESSLPVSGTHPISIRVQARVIRAFKAQAAKSSTGYQSLMNSALKAAADALV